MARFILEGEWTGYVSAQRRVVHREIVRDAKRADRLRKLHAILYTDGTSLILSLRELAPRQKVEEINSYGSLIREAERSGKSRFVIGRDDEAEVA